MKKCVSNPWIPKVSDGDSFAVVFQDCLVEEGGLYEYICKRKMLFGELFIWIPGERHCKRLSPESIGHA